MCKSISVTKWPSIDNSVADTWLRAKLDLLGFGEYKGFGISRRPISWWPAAHPQSTRRAGGVEGKQYTLADTRHQSDDQISPNKEAKEVQAFQITKQEKDKYGRVGSFGPNPLEAC